MKAILQFDLDNRYDRLAHKRALNNTAAYIAIHRIAEEVFRPARKHGYADGYLQNLLDNGGLVTTTDGRTTTNTCEIVDRLESLFYEILNEQNIDLGDLE